MSTNKLVSNLVFIICIDFVLGHERKRYFNLLFSNNIGPSNVAYKYNNVTKNNVSTLLIRTCPRSPHVALVGYNLRTIAIEHGNCG